MLHDSRADATNVLDQLTAHCTRRRSAYSSYPALICEMINIAAFLQPFGSCKVMCLFAVMKPQTKQEEIDASMV